MQPSATQEKSSLLSRPAFLPVAVGVLILGNMLDLIGTYIVQPHFENEANLTYNALKAHGIYLGWSGAILGKIFVCLVGAWALRLFLIRRRAYYPAGSADFREFITQLFWGRPLSWAETFYRWPRSWRPTFLTLGALFCLAGPYYAYLGYENLAVTYGWWYAPWFNVGRLELDMLLVVFLPALLVWLCWLLWEDYRSLH